MPVLDSFKVDHTKMKAPSVRIAKTMKTKKGEDIMIFDLRFLAPNTDVLPEKGLHTLEHLFAGYMRDYLNSDSVEIIDISPMGCKTGFYMSLIGAPVETTVATAFKKSMETIISLPDNYEIPAANPLQCGSYLLHSLSEAKEIAKNVTKKGICVNHNDDLLMK